MAKLKIVCKRMINGLDILLRDEIGRMERRKQGTVATIVIWTLYAFSLNSGFIILLFYFSKSYLQISINLFLFSIIIF